MFSKFSTTLCLVAAMLMLVPGELLLAQEEGQVIIISEKVGETIDREERDRYGLFPASQNFQSAMILQLPDSSYVAEISEEYRGVRKIRKLPLDQATVNMLTGRIDNFDELSSAEKAEIRTRYEKIREAITASSEWREGKVIVISPKVGESIDRDERDRYQLFPGSLNFLSAVILQLPDSSYVAEITEEQDGDKKVRTITIDQHILDELRGLIDTGVGPSPTLKGRFPTRPKDLETIIQQQSAVKKAKEQAKIMMKEKWTKERWREESSYDRGLSYRASGAVLGFTLGAMAGMLIGKGFQGRKVERSIHHPGEWEGPEAWTEAFYSYEHRYAPLWGGAIGGIGGAATGYYFGKKADKQYYILVPRNIRTMQTESPGSANCVFGFSIMGPIMGGVAGYALYMPTSGEAGKDFGWPHFAGGFFAGGALGSAFMSGYTSRAKYKRLWEESLLEKKPESSLDIQLMPLDPTAFALQARRLPSGEIIYEYHVDMLRVRF